MAGLWFSVSLALLFLFMDSVILQDHLYANKIAKLFCNTCLDPVRPTNTLGNLKLTDPKETFIDLEMRPCRSSGEGGDDNFYFRMRRLLIDGHEEDSRDLQLFGWESYGPCNYYCEMYIHLGFPQVLVNHTSTMSLEDLIWLNCDYPMKNCTVLLWSCKQWTRDVEEGRIIQSVREMFATGE